LLTDEITRLALFESASLPVWQCHRLAGALFVASLDQLCPIWRCWLLQRAIQWCSTATTKAVQYHCIISCQSCSHRSRSFSPNVPCNQ
jgi:hypothetical protein